MAPRSSLVVLLAIGLALSACTQDAPTEPQVPIAAIELPKLSISDDQHLAFAGMLADARERVVSGLPGGHYTRSVDEALQRLSMALESRDAQATSLTLAEAKYALEALEAGRGPELDASLADLSALQLVLGQVETVLPTAAFSSK